MNDKYLAGRSVLIPAGYFYASCSENLNYRGYIADIGNNAICKCYIKYEIQILHFKTKLSVHTISA